MLRNRRDRWIHPKGFDVPMEVPIRRGIRVYPPAGKMSRSGSRGFEIPDSIHFTQRSPALVSHLTILLGRSGTTPGPPSPPPPPPPPSSPPRPSFPPRDSSPPLPYNAFRHRDRSGHFS